jgi:hypothetical protein
MLYMQKNSRKRNKLKKIRLSLYKMMRKTENHIYCHKKKNLHCTNIQIYAILGKLIEIKYLTIVT